MIVQFLLLVCVRWSIVCGQFLTTTSCVTGDGRSGTCTLFADCPVSLRRVFGASTTVCSSPNIYKGVCCPVLPTAHAVAVPVVILSPSFETQEAINQAVARGKVILKKRDVLEQYLFLNGVFVSKGSTESFHQSFLKTLPAAIQLSRPAFINNFASAFLQEQFQLTHNQSMNLQTLSITSSAIADSCPKNPVCNPFSRYRTFDGTCNNLLHPNWGKSFTAFQRNLGPDYADAISKPRIASDGSQLPSPRLVSVVVVPDVNNPSQINTRMLMQVGQFLDHDLTLTAISRGQNDSGLRCCGAELESSPELRHPECFPIDIPAGDPFYSRFGETCMEFVRSLAAPRPLCNFGPREQLNQLTSYVDASQIYGSTEDQAAQLRSFQKGLLKHSKINNRNFPPINLEPEDECGRPQDGLFCFQAGDERINEQVDLTAMHIIWFREHNRIATWLHFLNPHWEDEQLYQEARKITGAEWQHIVYKEFLPIILGENAINALSLNVTSSGRTLDYDPSINPTITNEFAAAAYRYGHTLIQGILHLINPAEEISGALLLHQHFNRPFHLYQSEGLDSLLRGLATQPSQSYDRFITREVTNHLFQTNNSFGLDLLSLNIQRGRDHGLPSYNAWREFCGLGKVKTFDDLLNDMNPNSVESLKTVYKNVDDIDLFIGGIAERSVKGAVLGPTFSCITADQFWRLKFGDRYWYERFAETGFTEAQVDEIRKVTLARIICDNSDSISSIQPNVLHLPSEINKKVSCLSKNIPRLNIFPWKEAVKNDQS